MTARVNKHYEGFNREAMVMSQGDWQKADYLVDCTWYEYFHRKEEYRKYVEWYNAELKKPT